MDATRHLDLKGFSACADAKGMETTQDVLHPHRNPQRSALAAVVGVMLCSTVAPALGQGGFAERQEQRRKESWYFSQHLGAKSESARQDVLYRFYRSQAHNPRPRLEPFVFGLGATVLARDFATSGVVDGTSGGTLGASDTARREGFRSAGYGGELYFNDFVSGILGIPTLNIVPGVRAERLEDDGSSANRVTTSWGPSLRLFGSNAQDTALFLSYRNTRRDALGERYQAWHWLGGGRIYLLPVLAGEGEAQFSETFWPGRPDARAKRASWWAGGYLEVSVVRAGFRYSFEEYSRADGVDAFSAAGSHDDAPHLRREERRAVYIGISY
jgi:hypothetical protein